MENVKAVFFDYDNTLGNRYLASYNAYKELVNEHSNLPKDDLLREAVVQDMMTADQCGNVNFAYTCRKVTKKFNFRFFIEDPDNWWNDNFYRFAVINKGTLDLLMYLKRKGYRLGVITNGSAFSQRNKIRHIGIEDFFEAIIVSGDYDFKKPQKELFLEALKAFDLPAEECLYVGDTFSNDIYGALKAGMQAVWIWPDNISRPIEYPVHKIHNMSELKEIL